jgi:hypothetical protein
MPMNWDVNDMLTVVRVLVQAGFQKTSQLENIASIDWGTKDHRIKASINAVVMHVTQVARHAAEQQTVWRRIEEMLKSAETLAPRTVRPESGGPAAAVRAAGIASWSPETKRRRLEDAGLNAVVDSVTGGRKSYVSAAKGFLCFMSELHPTRVPLPPTIDDLVLWASFFKNAGTFSTYCSAVKWVTEGSG